MSHGQEPLEVSRQKLTNLLSTSGSLIQGDAFHKFLLDESSLTLVVFAFLSFAVFNVLIFNSDELEGYEFIVFIFFRIGAFLSSLTYLLFLSHYKHALPNSCILDKIDGMLVSSLAVFFGCTSTAIQIIFNSRRHFQQNRGYDDEDIMTMLFMLLQLFYFRSIFKIAYSWTMMYMGILAVCTLLVCVILNKFPVPLGFLIVFSACLGHFFATEYSKLLLHWYVNYNNLENLFRQILVQENEQQKMSLVTNELRSFIGNVAHDLKTPLQSIMSDVHAIRQLNDPVEREVVVSSLIGHCKLTIMMLNRSLDFVKMESGVPLLASPRTVNITHIMGEASDYVKSVCDCDTLQVIEPLISKNICPNIITDKSWLVENMLGLVANAIQFTKHGTIGITVSRSTLSDLNLMMGICSTERDNDSTHESLVLPSVPSVPCDDDPPRVDEGSSLSHTGPNHMPNVVLGGATGITMGESDVESQKQFYDSMLSLESINFVPSSETSDFLIFEVQDSGVGLSTEHMDTIFNPPVQSERVTGGTGLGLYMLRKRCEVLGGHCGVSKRLNGQKGSRFWFALPYVPAPTPALLTKPPPLETESNLTTNTDHQKSPCTISEEITPETTRFRILLVDDSVLIQKTTTRALRRQGCEVVIASNGYECLDALAAATEPFNLIMLDIQMPEMVSGQQLIHMSLNSCSRNRSCYTQLFRENIVKIFVY
jgi:signal transduction histidine kinase